MIFKVLVVALLLGILAWTWTAAALLRYIGGQLNMLISEIQQLVVPRKRIP